MGAAADQLREVVGSVDSERRRTLVRIRPSESVWPASWSATASSHDPSRLPVGDYGDGYRPPSPISCGGSTPISRCSSMTSGGPLSRDAEATPGPRGRIRP